MHKRKTLQTLLAACAAAALLASCGSRDDSDAQAPATASGSQVPDSATTSADGAFNFVATVAATGDDTAEPLVLGEASLATSETDEPRAVQ